MALPALGTEINQVLQNGVVIPAHPLALTSKRVLDEERQRRLTQYYLQCGAGGVAVGVHTTQFEIRKPEVNLLDRVLRIASEEIDLANSGRPIVKVAGIVGDVGQAMKEADLAVKYGYHLGLVSMGGLPYLSEAALIARLQKIAAIIPVFGFYLQPAVGGRRLSYTFWKEVAEIPNLMAIKVAAFNRYQTLDVIRAVCDSSRHQEIALYTGNDDNIVADLVTPYRFVSGSREIEKRFVGGLLGHWAVWTRAAVRLLEQIRTSNLRESEAVSRLLSVGVKVTDMNAAIFDPANEFKGCIAGIQEVLRRQGLLEGRWCLNPREDLSPGQLEEIERVCRSYPELTDDPFVEEFLKRQTVK